MVTRHVNNQLSGVPTSGLGLICFLLELSNYLDRFNPYSIRLAAGFELRIDLIVDKSDGDKTDQLEKYPGLRMVEPTEHRTGLVNNAKRSGLLRRDPLSTYLAFPVNPDNTQQTAEIFEYLKANSLEPDRIHQYKLRGKVIGWSRLTVTDAQKTTIEGHDGIKKPLERNMPIEWDLVAPKGKQPSLTRSVYASFLENTTRHKRAVTWAKQEDSVKDLRMISQPK